MDLAAHSLLGLECLLAYTVILNSLLSASTSRRLSFNRPSTLSLAAAYICSALSNSYILLQSDYISACSCSFSFRNTSNSFLESILFSLRRRVSISKLFIRAAILPFQSVSRTTPSSMLRTAYAICLPEVRLGVLNGEILRSSIILPTSSCTPAPSPPALSCCLPLRKAISLSKDAFSCLRVRYSLSSRFKLLLSLSSQVKFSFSYLSSLSSREFLPLSRLISSLNWYSSSFTTLLDLGERTFPPNSLLLLVVCCILEWSGCLGVLSGLLPELMLFCECIPLFLSIQLERGSCWSGGSSGFVDFRYFYCTFRLSA